MVSFEKVTLVSSSEETGNKYWKEGSCMSGDTKPTDVANGSILKEMDTGTVYMYDEAGEQWRPFE